ncbi:hypothetical protein K490DRAFT_63141 [Saccharata proteae CBS 121410]|uniref:Uncharacterized protein n=1 Tax=Saccharata proteae CBS 121410 TaxID=1314787 RepID=A0A9P4LYT1_9PEZI|nr:hypothetical protein K490DRAFT_63141 [Saccharata proteae CBS 121410]
MSSNLMETERGGESNAYESIKTVTEPHSKQGGQLSSPETVSPSHLDKSSTTNSQGISNADKIRYGQAMSEKGMGGQTGPGHNEGEADAQKEEVSEGMAQSRREQGYGGAHDMNRQVGA